MISKFTKLAAVFAVLIIGGAIAFNHYTGANADNESFSREEIQEIVKETIMENPGIIMEALQKHRIEQQQEQQQFLIIPFLGL